MYLDIIASNGFISVNKNLLKAFGPTPAIYLSQLANQAGRAVRNNQFFDGVYIVIDRAQIQASTGFTTQAQLQCDEMFAQLEIIQLCSSNQDAVIINFEKVISIISGYDAKQLAKLNKTAKTALKTAAKTVKQKTTANKPTVDKQALMVQTMKKCITQTDPQLWAAYADWVEAVYAGKRFLTKKIMQLFKAGLDAYTTDKSTKLAILQQATTSGYTQIAWVLNRYESVQKQAPQKFQSQQRVSTGVLQNTTF